jgi:uncharacterized protein YceK
MKNPLLVLAVIALLSGCATTSRDFGVVRNGQTRCLEQASAESAKTGVIRWCTSRQMFQPNRHNVSLGTTTLFAGTDYADVKFEKQIDNVIYAGSCIPEIDITDMQTSRPVLVGKLPKELIVACDIKSNERGEMLPYARTNACAAVSAKELGPIVGSVFPFKRTQRCSLVANGEEVFKGSFRYE